MMPISYSVEQKGHFIHAVAETPCSKQDFIDFEVAHATDRKVVPPLTELFEISAKAFKDISMEDVQEVLKIRGEIDRLPTPHRCAIALHSLDKHTWKLARFYEGMAMLHSPETVIVFANPDIAKILLISKLIVVRLPLN